MVSSHGVRRQSDDDGLLEIGMARVRIRSYLGDAEAGRIGVVPDAGAFSGEIVDHAALNGTLCVGTRVAGFAPRASVVTLPAVGVSPLRAESSWDLAAAVPLLGVAVQAVRVARVRSGQHALVLGSGLFAQLITLVLGIEGAMQISRGTGMTVPGGNGTAGPIAPDIVVDSTGDPALWMPQLEASARLGRIILIGASRGRTADVDFYRTVHRKGLELIGVPDAGPLSLPVGSTDRDRDFARAQEILDDHADRIGAVLRDVGRL